MTTVGEVFVTVRPDTAGFEGEADARLTGTFKNIAKNAVKAFGAVKVAEFLGGTIQDASDLNETISKSNTIFGESGKSIARWADSANTNIGQSKQQALEAAATFGNMFSQLGIGSDVTADMSKQMVELASDFASFHNADISEVLMAQTAAFRGEFDAVQRFVPTINAAAVEQKALAMTHKATTKELTLQEKALATQALLMEGAGKATGDFDRTSDGLANKQRILQARLADVKTTIGSALMPVMLQAVNVFADFLPVIEPLLPVLVPLAGAIGAIVVATKIWTAVQTALNVVLTANPIGLVVLAIAALVAGLVLAYRNSETFRNIVNGAFQAVAAVVGTVVNFIKGNWQTLFVALTGPVGLAVLAIRAHFDTIIAAAKAVIKAISDVIAKLSEVAKKVTDNPLGKVGKGAAKTILGGIPGGSLVAPFFHSGGVFRAPTPGGEGLAVLQDQETVLPPGAGGGQVVHVQVMLREQVIAEAIYDPLRRLNAGTT